VTTVGDIGAGHTLGRYELLMPIASGGMAVVWSARLKGTRGFQKIVAIKTMRPEMVEDAQFEQMFLDEASLASRIRHPHVVEIMDLGEEAGVLYLVMEWIDGEPLHIVMKEASGKGGILLPIAVRIAMQVCAGLHAAHELRDESGKLVGLVHRDVSPQNVLVTWDGVAKVVDFGVAKAVGRGAGETVAGQVKGKTAYMAPEQARGGAIDRRTDVFAIGILLYTMTTGRHPFRRENDLATMMNICSDERVYRPGKLIPGYPPQLEKVVMQALEKDPAKRFPTANDMLKALDHALPSSMRVSSDDEVAAFVRSLMGERFEKRRDKIKEGLRIADERAAGAAKKKAETTSPHIVPLSDASAPGGSVTGQRPAVAPPVERWSITEATPGSGAQAAAEASNATNAPAVLLPPELSSSGMPAQKSSSKFIVVGLAAVAVIGIVAITAVLSGRKPDVPIAAASPNSAPPPTATQPVEVPTATAVVTAEPPPVVASATASAAPAETGKKVAGKGPVGGPAKGGPAAATGAAPPTAVKTASPPPTSGSLPQVRNPGF
jgi:serine/threonine-protein kinase